MDIRKGIEQRGRVPPSWWNELSQSSSNEEENAE